MEQTTQTTVRVKGMHCHSCEALITEALEEQGATKVTANWKTGSVTLNHDKTLTAKAINKIIADEGYKVDEQ